ncbi:hypothetical protein F5Y14DRAFT_169231 [Nemania sp. NC0429]|nr:hypothetical protein F5Y14DRAFT_169231 [Nemania sp. NC0429]
MGSLAADTHYPDASDETLILTHPTAAEMERTWRLNHREWGGPLDLPSYLGREKFLASTPLAANGGMLHWILTEAHDEKEKDKEEKRRVLASCETIRKRVLYVPPAGAGDKVREGLGYGIGSVYTYPEFRGKKYAARMLKELGSALRTQPAAEEKGVEEQPRKKYPQKHHVNGSRAAVDAGSDGANEGYDGVPQKKKAEAVCSALWSDIGKRFYASKGWPVFASEHVEFPSSPSSPSPPGIPSLLERSGQPHGASLTLVPVNTSNLTELCLRDEAQLRGDLLRHARDTGRTAFAFAPDHDVFRWHWAREEYIVSRVFPGRQASEVRGMIATVTSTSTSTSQTNAILNGGGDSERGRETRIWAIWMRNYGEGAASNPAKNTLYILRLVIDNGNDNDNDAASSAPPPLNENGVAVPSSPGSQKALQLAFDAIMHSAVDTARAWHCGSVHLWNPTPAVRGLIAGSGLAHKFVDREVDSIPSMMWYADKEIGKGEGEGEGKGTGVVDWIANDKYCWC